MIYVPPALEETVREWVQRGRKVDELLDFISAQCLEQILQQKQQILGRPQDSKASRKRRRKDHTP
jgi:hypothetical protein